MAFDRTEVCVCGAIFQCSGTGSSLEVGNVATISDLKHAHRVRLLLAINCGHKDSATDICDPEFRVRCVGHKLLVEKHGDKS